MRTLLTRSITGTEVADLRRAVARHATGCGLASPRLEDFVLAVHESVINVVTHAGGHGHVKLWTVDGVLGAETVDHGAGIPGGYLEVHRRPPATVCDGRGLYLIRELSDGVTVRTGPRGTRVEITMLLPVRRVRRRSPMKRIRVAADGQPGGFTA
ncbi:ATP-binding protein [Nonomuraea sp. MCN248]|uniref:ATP-binding protein n=1 Tax=Nonomuraea corallina TaxID=2989783 RepID=A0ABT4S9H7_9ACTN|nr:ATP-binding protein [Nonomuraea corallina]MDA0633819.1 ATP-binding protein [Nonomuraea corallina]